jgi:DnaB helicase-like protein
MQLSTAVQEALLALSCYDDTVRGAKLVRTLTPATTYDVYYRDVIKASFDYFDKYGKSPGAHTLDIFLGIKARQPDSEDIYDRIYRSLQKTKDKINREYVLKQAGLFSRKQALKTGIANALTALDRDDEQGVNEADTILEKSRQKSVELFHPGTFLSSANALNFLDIQDDTIPLGIPYADKLGQGMARKRLLIFMAPYGKGKTWALSHMAKLALLTRHRVAVVTCELSEEDWCQRLIMGLFAVSRREATIIRKKFKRDEDGTWIDMKDIEIKGRPHFRQAKIRKVLIDKLNRLGKRKPPILIRQFPTGSLTMGELEAWLDGLEVSHGFIPDALIVDYAELMKISSEHEQADISKLYKDLRGLAIKRNMAVATASQSNRSGEDVKMLTGKHVAADYSKLGTADVVITYNQTPSEHQLGLARLNWLKGRGDKDRFTILVSQAYGIGQFCLDSATIRNPRQYFDVVDGESGGEES